MNTEIEVKFLDVNHDAIREKLRAIGAVCEKPMRVMRRVTFDNAEMKARNGWIRMRDEGDKVTLTYKQTDSYDIDGTKELETTVGDFDTAVGVLEQAGIARGSFQESKRESWRLGDVQVELDEWPWLKPYIEIEAPSEAGVHEVAAKLGFDVANAVSGDVMVAYRAEYPHLGTNDTVGNLAEVKFGAPLPDIFVQ
ncbi:MAG: class IV adenylate cyclase [Candidatus Saccharimonas sp.]